ncbi:MAG: RNA-binding transcriptional accessory protein [Clostridia bacterium]|nr:RNA-binding transcriptional accessory protein [Clostridia bacterium]MBQ4586644.1 RNA-binding transcriptional accessory protein [Clostridia bacterium]MBQ6883489.1 RNA-binding transcriptional accessory protein [Clostridia bacterium]
MNILERITNEFNLRPQHVENIVELLDQGNTIPFIARYRKELTGHIDDQVLREFSDRLTYLRNLEKRKQDVQSAIEEQGKLTEEIILSLNKAETLTEVEDIYRPYKQKKKTRATVAIAKGLEPLADIIMAQDITSGTVEDLATPYISEEKGVKNAKEAIDGARDIIAERISDDAELRKKLRRIFVRNGEISSKLAKTDKEGAEVYEMYAEYKEAVSEIKSHRVLALNRGEKEGFLRVKVAVDKDFAYRVCRAPFVKMGSITTHIVEEAADDSYDRLIYPSIEREIRSDLTDQANEQAIKMFEVNLEPLLMQPPVKDKITMGFDPAYRTGCKIAVVDDTGKVLDKTVVYPTPPQSKVDEAKFTLIQLINKYKVDVISIGNGTASKESEIFVADLIKSPLLKHKVSYIVVSEAGASVYSASKLGAEEFPDYDVSERSAVSIARRLQDPLAELIKIDPKSIGVGQYQHDMPQARLDDVLKGVLEDCVNKVGVNPNTASVSLLTYVAGLNSAIAKNIVKYRDENGKFKTRRELLKVSKLGEKAFEQCAGFIRIPDGKNVLDNTGVHPESYDATAKLLDIFGYTADDVKNGKVQELAIKVKNFGEDKVAALCGMGVPTLKDVLAELAKPGRDVRDSLPQPMLRSDILSISDLTVGMKITGTVRNVIDFGAFVDIGVHQDGLVHISEISDNFIRHPSEALKVGQVVTVTVLGVDVKKNRISLTMRQNRKNA